MAEREWQREWRLINTLEKNIYNKGVAWGYDVAYRRGRVGYQHPAGPIFVNEIDWSYAKTLELIANMDPQIMVIGPDPS